MPGQIGDLKVDAAISPKTTLFPATYVEVVQGADYEVADTTQRDLIPYAYLRLGQIIRTTADGKAWKVSSLTPPSTIVWVQAQQGAPQPTVRSTAGPVALAQAAWQKWVNAYAGGAITYQLPASPVLGDVFELAMGALCSTYPVTVDGNGQTILGAATLVNRTNSVYLTIMFDGTGWVIT